MAPGLSLARWPSPFTGVASVMLCTCLASCLPVIERKGIVGHEIGYGPEVSVPPLSMVTTSAQCPPGKVALSAGYEFSAGADPATRFGLEAYGAVPVDRLGTVLLRNANVVVAATARAIAICAQEPSGTRTIRSTDRCNSSERLAGGGYLGHVGRWVASNGPGPSPLGSIDWGMHFVEFFAETVPAGYIGWRALCAPEHAVDGWEYVESAPVALGARAAVELSVTCPVGKVLLGAGVTRRDGNELDLVTSKLTLTAAGARADVRNRTVLGASGLVTAALGAICARRE